MNTEAIMFTIERLKAIDSDEQLRQQFDLGKWANTFETHPLDQPEDPRCGFAGCYFGWAVHQQWYERYGLRMAFSRSGTYPHNPDFIHPVVLHSSDTRFLSFVDDHWNGSIEAVARLFGVLTDAVRMLIYNENYPSVRVTAGMVAARLELMLAEGDESLIVTVKAELDEASQQDEEGDEV